MRPSEIRFPIQTTSAPRTKVVLDDEGLAVKPAQIKRRRPTPTPFRSAPKPAVLVK